MAKQPRFTGDILTPEGDPTLTKVKRPGTEDTKTTTRYGTICVRARIVHPDTGDMPDDAYAEIRHRDPGPPGGGNFPDEPPPGAHAAERGDFGDHNCRWDQHGGEPVDRVRCDHDGRNDNWLLVWARWGTGAVWDFKDVVRVNGICDTKTQCE